jgi:K+-sensing histidine kinase KdpD
VVEESENKQAQNIRESSELPQQIAEQGSTELERKGSEQVQSAIYRISESAQSAQNLDELYRSIHATIAKLMPAKNFYISLYDEAADLFTVPYLVDEYDEYWPPYKPGKGLGAYIMRTGKPLLATPVKFSELEKSGEAEIISRRMVDWLGVPLKTQYGKTIGVMAVQTYDEEHRLVDTDQDVLMFVSTQVAMAIERKQAEQALQQQAQELAMLNTLGQKVNASLLLDQVVKAAIENVLALNRYDLVLCYLHDDNQLVLQGISPEAAIEFYSKTQSHIECLTGQAAQTGKPIYSIDVTADTRCTRSEVKESGLQSFAAMPLRSGEDIIGVLGLATLHEHDFSLESTFLETMANQIATATQNALLHSEVQEYASDLERRVKQRTAQLENTNKELEAFAYSVSHDLRGPLRAIDGYSNILLEDYGSRLDEEGRDFLQRLRQSSQHMGQLIDDLLKLSRLTRQEMTREKVDLGALAVEVFRELNSVEMDRKIVFTVGDELTALADARLMQVALANLFSNAIKFTRKVPQAEIEFDAWIENGEKIFFVRDNGAGFDMRYANKLFAVFERLHSASEFEGNGIGLATVQRIINRHGGRLWAEGAINQGATFYFTLDSLE